MKYFICISAGVLVFLLIFTSRNFSEVSVSAGSSIPSASNSSRSLVSANERGQDGAAPATSTPHSVTDDEGSFDESSTSNLPALLSWFDSNSSGDLRSLQVRQVLLQKLAMLPIETVFTLLNETKIETQVDILPGLIKNGSPVDRADFQKWLVSTKSKEALFKIIERLSELDPVVAVDFVAGLPESSTRETAEVFVQEQKNLRYVQGRWAVLQPDAATRWSETLPPMTVTDKITKQITRHWIQRSPELAAQYVSTLPSGEMQESAALSVVSAWGLLNPERARDWVNNFAEGQLKDESRAFLNNLSAEKISQ